MADDLVVANPTAGDGAGFGDAGEAMHAVSRLLRQGIGDDGPAAVREQLVREARSFFRVTRALLLTVVELEGRVEVAAIDPAGRSPDGLLAIVELPGVEAVIDDGEPVRIDGAVAARLSRAIIPGSRASSVLLLPIRLRGEVRFVLMLADGRRREFSEREVEVAGAFAGAAAAGLAQLQLAADHAERIAREAALARAAKTLNDSLDMNRVLVRICRESTSILDGDVGAVYLGNARDGLRMEAALGFPTDAIGTRLEAGEGLAGLVAERAEPLLTNDYQGLPGMPRREEYRDIRSALAVPMEWDGELRGVLSVGYSRPHLVTRDQLGLLETFADIAAAACRNADAHAGLAVAARTDALTGCLNHAAMHDELRRELERTRRTGGSLSLAIVDLDDFKRVNEQHGHQAGDDVLRTVGKGLRHSVRAYDPVARYGGDEFAVVAIGADEDKAIEVIERALEGVAKAVVECRLPAHAGRATAGVAEWDGEESAAGLIERADRALLHAKHEGGRGTAWRASKLPGQEALSDSR